ncbi:MAG: GatB/YqeY domain-containing protein [Patescibacteria group bacterium]
MIHQTIKDGIKNALRARETLRLEVLRGLNALCMNEIIATATTGESLPDEKVLALIKRSAKQRKDSIEQFDKGGRKDLADKERAELVILNSFLPTLMSREEIKNIVMERIETLKSVGTLDLKAGGKITGIIMKELAGKAEGSDVKAVVEEVLKN